MNVCDSVKEQVFLVKGNDAKVICVERVLLSMN
jgi:hypothetical protein